MLEKTITKEQIKCIKTVQRRHQSDDEYHEMLEERFKVTSCTQLTRDQGTLLIKLYKKWGWTNLGSRGTKHRAPAGNVTRGTKHRAFEKGRGTFEKGRGTKLRAPTGNVTKMVSPAQKKKIGALANMIGWRVKDGLTRWVSKRFSTDRIKTAQQAWQVIEGLKKMFERQMEKQYGQGWRNLDYDDNYIRRYIEEHNG